MDSPIQHQNMRDHKEEKQRNQESDHQNSSSTQPSSSNSSSPSHEFSFTISFQQTKQTPHPPSSSSSFAIDLSPADDIFFHGHLLPLHLLSHLPISSPRSSTNSLDSFTTLPKKDHFFHQEHKVQNSKNHQRVLLDDDDDTSCDAKGKPKAKSFSLFGIPKWRKGYEVKDHQKENKERLSQQYSKKMTQVVKRYIRMLRGPFLSFRNKKNMQFHHRQSYSFSGNLLSGKNNKEYFRGIKGQYLSAPASMRTSPTNSGLLVATTPTGGANSSYSSSDHSTMEELQAAIQAAIAHCKKSISMEDKIKLP
ncbi:hypothetical protein HAX54_005271 [Datura stramonium]|uniref:BRI1 kinase inhibitor 1 n=1 Tax=Datura stramonium TaxID=4076 RepID=A0ABS8T9P6_DATST|nr:hypothetical protein [Datura stramonium]